MRSNRHLLAASLVLTLLAPPLSGCAMFSPRYDLTVDQKTSSAFEDAAAVAAAAELGSYADKASYGATADRYAGAKAKLAVASLRAGQLQVQGKAARSNRDDLIGFIQGCGTQIDLVAALHKLEGVQPRSGATAAMMTACDQAARAAQILKPGS